MWCALSNLSHSATILDLTAWFVEQGTAFVGYRTLAL